MKITGEKSLRQGEENEARPDSSSNRVTSPLIVLTDEESGLGLGPSSNESGLGPSSSESLWQSYRDSSREMGSPDSATETGHNDFFVDVEGLNDDEILIDDGSRDSSSKGQDLTGCMSEQPCSSTSNEKPITAPSHVPVVAHKDDTAETAPHGVQTTAGIAADDVKKKKVSAVGTKRQEAIEDDGIDESEEDDDCLILDEIMYSERMEIRLNPAEFPRHDDSDDALTGSEIVDASKPDRSQRKKTSGLPSTGLAAKRGCFNCAGDHLLETCPIEKDDSRIELNREKFRITIGRQSLPFDSPQLEKLEVAQLKTIYTDVRPGEISETLRQAMGLGKHETPRHVYNMRGIGYPPGYEKLACKLLNHGILLDDNKVISKQEFEKWNVLIDQIPDYPGFTSESLARYRRRLKSHTIPYNPNQATTERERMKSAIRGYPNDPIKSHDAALSSLQFFKRSLSEYFVKLGIIVARLKRDGSGYERKPREVNNRKDYSTRVVAETSVDYTQEEIEAASAFNPTPYPRRQTTSLSASATTTSTFNPTPFPQGKTTSNQPSATTTWSEAERVYKSTETIRRKRRLSEGDSATTTQTYWQLQTFGTSVSKAPVGTVNYRVTMAWEEKAEREQQRIASEEKARKAKTVSSNQNTVRFSKRPSSPSLLDDSRPLKFTRTDPIPREDTAAMDAVDDDDDDIMIIDYDEEKDGEVTQTKNRTSETGVEPPRKKLKVADASESEDDEIQIIEEFITNTPRASGNHDDVITSVPKNKSPSSTKTTSDFNEHGKDETIQQSQRDLVNLASTSSRSKIGRRKSFPRTFQRTVPSGEVELLDEVNGKSTAVRVNQGTSTSSTVSPPVDAVAEDIVEVPIEEQSLSSRMAAILGRMGKYRNQQQNETPETSDDGCNLEPPDNRIENPGTGHEQQQNLKPTDERIENSKTGPEQQKNLEPPDERIENPETGNKQKQNLKPTDERIENPETGRKQQQYLKPPDERIENPETGHEQQKNLEPPDERIENPETGHEQQKNLEPPDERVENPETGHEQQKNLEPPDERIENPETGHKQHQNLDPQDEQNLKPSNELIENLETSDDKQQQQRNLELSNQKNEVREVYNEDQLLASDSDDEIQVIPFVAPTIPIVDLLD